MPTAAVPGLSSSCPPALLAKAKAMGGAILYMWLTMSATHLVLRLRREREAPYLLVARMRGLP
ncbi:hypothetical protein ACFQ63_01140 [Streptomyces wedmorensis]|uniref:Uncharacterized protein n=1 Tax=Streptomyces wedmorensis TaxID=43759 RepID=A0ABW6IMZ6_STRWE